MILRSLVDYYDALADRGEIARPGWSLEKISFAANISSEGELLNLVPLKQAVERKGKTAEIPVTMTVPERVVKASGIRSNFLCETANYMLALDTKGNPKRTLECFDACKQLHQDVLAEASGAVATAVKAFFRDWNAALAPEHPALQPYLEDLQIANIVIMVEEKFAHEDSEIKACWERHRAALSEAKSNAVCLVTGKEGPVALIHGKIKGIPDGQPAGMTLVGFNARAFESYGKENAQGLNAPVSEYATFAYVTALNRLLADREHSCRIGDASVVYWAEQAEPKAQQTFSWFLNPEPDTQADLDGVMQNLSSGKPIQDVDMEKRFFILGLAPNAARVSVRFFLQDSFGNMIENLRQHYLRLEIVQPAYRARHYLSVPALLFQTVNPNSKSKAAQPLLSGEVMRAILTGAPYPHALYTAILNRIRADRNISPERAAIIKACLMRNYDEKEVTSVALNQASDNRAYVLGRLFAVLEETQKRASPGINTTIKDSFFTAASTTPGSVFPQLLQLSVHHMKKLDNGMWLERKKKELLDKLDVASHPFPAQHSLKEQGDFLLGYYHQTQL